MCDRWVMCVYLVIMIYLVFRYQLISLLGQLSSELKKGNEVKHDMRYANKNEHDLQIGFIRRMLPSIVQVVH